MKVVYETRCKSLALLLALLSMVGCTLSLHPLFTDKDTVFESALVGAWQNDQEGATWFLRQAGGSYLLETDMKDQPRGQFTAQLGLIGQHRFLQILPLKPAALGKSVYGGHFIQAFSFWRVTLDEDKLILTPLDSEWVQRMLKEEKLEIKHEQLETGPFVLTASTPELQAFILKYVNDPEAFGKSLQFERRNATNELTGAMIKKQSLAVLNTLKSRVQPNGLLTTDQYAKLRQIQDGIQKTLPDGELGVGSRVDQAKQFLALLLEAEKSDNGIKMLTVWLESLTRDEREAEANRRVRVISEALATYAYSHDGMLPSSLETLTGEHQTPEGMLIDPLSGGHFVYIGAGKRLLPDHKTIILHTSGDDKGRVVMFSDGSVQSVSAKQFQTLLGSQQELK